VANLTAAQTRRWLGLALLVYGSVGIVVMLRLLPLVAQAFSLWFGGSGDALRPIIPGLGPLEAHYDARPWLPWLAWIIGLLLVAPPFRDHPTTAQLGVTDPPIAQAGTADVEEGQSGINQAVSEAQPVTRQAKFTIRNSQFIIPLILLLLVLGVGAYTRLNLLLPQEKGLIEYPYDDEGVYAEASQLTLQGILPYRDYFFAHPPVASLVYIPAFAYHFTAWGSPTSFILGRYMSVGYSLLTALALFFLARKAARGMNMAPLYADIAGGVAAMLWAIDGQVVEINRKIMLDQPMVLFSALSLVCYLYALPRSEQHNRAERRWLVIAGIFAALAALTKIAGLAAGLGIFTHALAIAIERGSQQRRGGGRAGSNLKPKIENLKWLALGFAVTALLILIPYAIIAGGTMVREIFFFQLLRPGDGIADVPSRLPLITGALAGAITANPLTLLCAALGSVMLSWRVARGTSLGGWTPIILWNIYSFALFTYTGSFYTHYYIQLAAPLCLLGGAVALWPHKVATTRTSGDGVSVANEPAPASRWGRRVAASRYLYAAVTALIALLFVPMLVYQWGTTTSPHPDPMFRDVAKYVSDAVPPGTSVLTLDDQFNFLAARPPSYLPSTGYLVDSYGHMIYLGLNIGNRSISDLIGGIFHDPHSNDPYAAAMWQDAPQADMLQRIAAAPLIVTHDVGEARLRKDTLAKLAQMARLQPDASTSRYSIYRK
jgi:hypothetical protein